MTKEDGGGSERVEVGGDHRGLGVGENALRCAVTKEVGGRRERVEEGENALGWAVTKEVGGGENGLRRE